MRKFLVPALCILSFASFASCSSSQNEKTHPYQWKSVKFVAGGFITGIIFDPYHKDAAYVRTDIGGAYKWDKTAKKWIPLTDWVGPNDSNWLGTESIAYDPQHANRIYLAQGTYTQSWASNGAIFRSDDYGKTWSRSDMPFKMGANNDGRSIGERLAVDPNNSNILYFGSRTAGLWRSTDGSKTWKKVDNFPVATSDDAIGVGFVIFDKRTKKADKTQVVYVGVSGRSEGLYRTVDGGHTWKTVSGQPNDFMLHQGRLSPNGQLYLSYGNTPGPNGMSDGAVWRFDTHTTRWTDITPIHPNTIDKYGYGYAGLAVDYQHPDTVMVSTMDRWGPKDDIFRSTDKGAHWIPLRDNSTRDASLAPYEIGEKGADFGHWIGAVAIDPFNSQHAIYGTGSNMWGTYNLVDADRGKKTRWSVAADGIEETAATDIISPSSGAILHTSLGDVCGTRYTDLSVSPNLPRVFGTCSSIDFAEKDPNIIVRLGWHNGAQGAYSTDNGLTWQYMNPVPEASRDPRSISISADGKTIYTAFGQLTPYRSDSFGKSWTTINGLPNDMLRIVPDREIASDAYCLDHHTGRLFVSHDYGRSFSQLTTGLPKVWSRMKSVSGHPGDLWLPCDDDGLMRSRNGGKSFVKVNGPAYVNGVGFGKSAPGKSYPSIYITGEINKVRGIYRSDNEGATWERINDDQHQYGWVSIITGDPRVYGRVYIGTNGRGVLYGDITQ